MWYGLFVAQSDPAMPVFELQLTNFSVPPSSFQHCLKSHMVCSHGTHSVAVKPFHVLTVGVMKAITMWYGLFVAQSDPAMPVFELQLTNFSVPSFQHCLKSHMV
jgi:hypothetical protein